MKSLAEKLQFVKDFLKGLPEVDHQPISIQDVKYGVVDTFLFSKSKADINNVYTNARLILSKFDSIKDFVVFARANHKTISLRNTTLIAYRPLSNKYHFQLVKVFNIKTPDDWDKYLILM
jgi:hypothetical protein